MTFSTTFHDLLDPFTAERVSVRLAGGRMVEKATTIANTDGRNIDASEWWLLPGLYDADAHLPLVEAGMRASDAIAALNGGVTKVNVAVQWQDIAHLDLRSLLEDVDRSTLPRVVPILSVHPDHDSAGFGAWLEENAELVDTLFPPVCKLYSYGDAFINNLESAFTAGLLPVIYCRELADVEMVVANASGPVHFRHAMTAELVDAMKALPGATMQTSPHFLLPIRDDVREQLHVLPPVADAVTRQNFLPLVMDHIDLFVTDHNAPPLAEPRGPGLQVQQDFLAALITLAEINGWRLQDVWQKATEAASIFGRAHDPDDFVIVDPSFRREANLWQPRQTADRAPYRGIELAGRVIAIGNASTAAVL